jgi:hypothetical protein
MFFTVEGGPRAGKGLMQTYLAAWAHVHGLKVFANFPIRFPAKSFAIFNPAMREQYPDGFTPRLLPVSQIVDRLGNQLFFETDCFHARQEFYQEIESRSMGNAMFRYGMLDWLMQLGKMRSSLSGDAQDLDSLDKRFRVGTVTERLWAIRPWHERGEDFVYGVYDRPSMFGQVKRIREADIKWLYAYYDTLHRTTRDPITQR